jgi:PadR family transcriptional regulator AphA
MALTYALLSLLSRGEASGYDLSKLLQGPESGSVIRFWYAGHPQVYRELATMERRGLVTHRVVPQSQRPSRKVFTITQEGRHELLRWLRAPHVSEHHNSVTALKTFSLHLLPVEEAVAKLDEFASDARKMLGRSRQMQKLFAPVAAAGGTQLSSYLTVLFGRCYQEAYLRWCEEAKLLLARSAKGRAGFRKRQKEITNAIPDSGSRRQLSIQSKLHDAGSRRNH